MIYVCRDIVEAIKRLNELSDRGFEAVVLEPGDDISQTLFYKRTGLTLLDSPDSKCYIVITIDKIERGIVWV